MHSLAFMPPIHPTTTPGLPSQALSSSAPPPRNAQGPPFYPPLGQPYRYGHPGPDGSQYRPGGVGMSAPQLYYDPWGHGHYPPGPYPPPFPHAGDIQPTTAQVSERQARAEVGPTQAHARVEAGPTQTHAEVGPTQVHAEEGQVVNQPAPAEFQPKRFYPNKQISEGGIVTSGRLV